MVFKADEELQTCSSNRWCAIPSGLTLKPLPGADQLQGLELLR